MNINQRYMFRAKVPFTYNERDKQGNNTTREEVNWKFGYLKVMEICPSPVSIGDIKDFNNYFIVQREPNSFADWNMPYPNIEYYIPPKYHDTITPYLGWNDNTGGNIFIGDIIRHYSYNETFCDMVVTSNGLLNEDGQYFPPIYFVSPSQRKENTLSDFFIVGNVWDGARGSIQFEDWIALRLDKIKERIA